MSSYAEYSERVSERYGILSGLGTPTVSWEDAYVPLRARRGTNQARQDLARHKDAVIQARKRVRLERVKELLEIQPQVELMSNAPFGLTAAVEDLVRQDRRLVLLGGAGAGKTTALRYLAAKQPVSRLEISEEGETVEARLVPVMVFLPEVGDRSLSEYLSDQATSLFLLRTPAFFHDLLLDGRAVVCVDGLDEIADQAQKAQAVRQVESWIQDYPLCHYVIVSRPEGYTPAFDDEQFAHYELLPWKEGVAAEVETAWNQALDSLESVDANRPYYAARHRLWQHLALAMRQSGRQVVPVEEAQDWLVDAAVNDKEIRVNRRRARGEIERLFEESAPQLGMVRIEDGQLRFEPRLLGDVLAARALQVVCAEQGDETAWQLVSDYVGSAAWREPLRLLVRYLAQDDPRLWSRFTARMLDAEDSESLFHDRLLIAASALGSASGSLDRAARRRIVDGLWAWITNTESVGRRDAVNALYQAAADPYVAEQVVEKAGDKELDAWSRLAAVLLLGEVGKTRSSDGVDVLMATLDDQEADERLRVAASISLGALGSSGALSDELQQSVEQDLLERARNPEWKIGMRAAVIEALGTILVATHRPEILETMISLARAENEGEDKVPYSVQIGAAESLVLVLPQLKEQLVDRLWELARDEELDDSVRTPLAEALGKLDDPVEAGRVLISLARSDKVYPPGQRQALEAIASIGSAEQDVVDQIVEIAETKDRKVKDFVRLAASVALGKLGHVANSVQHLLMLIADKSIYRTTRNEALSFLGEMGYSGDAELDDATISVLQIWVTEENTTEDVRELAMDSLVKLKVNRDDVVRDLIGVVQDKSVYPRVRRYAAAVFKDLPVEDKEMVTEALSATLYDPEEKSDLLRVPIAHLLNKWGTDENALAYLKAAAEQSYMALARYRAAMYLLDLDEREEAIAVLLKLVENPEIADPIRMDAIRALSRWAVGDEQVAQSLAAVAKNAELEAPVREAAYAALKSVQAA